jgi:hypothetical protein
MDVFDEVIEIVVVAWYASMSGRMFAFGLAESVDHEAESIKEV